MICVVFGSIRAITGIDILSSSQSGFSTESMRSGSRSVPIGCRKEVRAFQGCAIFECVHAYEVHAFGNGDCRKSRAAVESIFLYCQYAAVVGDHTVFTSCYQESSIGID